MEEYVRYLRIKYKKEMQEKTTDPYKTPLKFV